MLYNVMKAVGFTNLPSEWWHYDYGDDKWAQLNHTSPLYAGILDAKLRNSVPYPNMDKVQELDIKQQSMIITIIDIRNTCKDISLQLNDLVTKRKRK